MRIAFIAHSIFDERMAYGLCHALADLSHVCSILTPPYKTKEILTDFDVIIEPQHTRSDVIPKDSVYITWVYEYYGAGDPDYTTLHDRDMLYSFGEPEIIGCPTFRNSRGSLTVAVEPQLLDRPLVEPTLDLSLAGFIPPLSWFYFPTLMADTHRFNVIAEIIHIVTEQIKISAFSGEFDQVAELVRFKVSLAELLAVRGWQFDSDWIEEMQSYGAKLLHNFARLLNRGTLAKLAISVSQNIEFWGQNWDIWEPTAKYAKPFNEDPEALYQLYQRSRINLHDNIFGFAIHWRVLDAMAVGGFIMSHGSPHVGKAGQMTSTFVPDVHFGEYNAHNFTERARYWLEAHDARRKVILDARKVIRDKHLWINRARQVLADLN